MKTLSTIGKPLQVLWFLFCGVSFYVMLFALLYLIGGLLVSSRVHAQTQGSDRPLVHVISRTKVGISY